MNKTGVLVVAMATFVLSACSAGHPKPERESTTPPASAPAAAATLNGTWKGFLIDSQDKHPIGLNLKVEGETVTGTMTGGPPTGAEQPIVNGRLAGERLSFGLKAEGPGGEALTLSFQGKLAGDRIAGTHVLPWGETATWEVAKQ